MSIFRVVVLPIVIAIAVAMIAFLIQTCFFLKDDNVIEEVCEEIIEDQTGLKIDLTYKTPE